MSSPEKFNWSYAYAHQFVQVFRILHSFFVDFSCIIWYVVLQCIFFSLHIRFGAIQHSHQDYLVTWKNIYSSKLNMTTDHIYKTNENICCYFLWNYYWQILEFTKLSETDITLCFGLKYMYWPPPPSLQWVSSVFLISGSGHRLLKQKRQRILTSKQPNRPDKHARKPQLDQLLVGFKAVGSFNRVSVFLEWSLCLSAVLAAVCQQFWQQCFLLTV